MKTLIELYDERPIENVLASEVFRPERTVFLCPGEIARSLERQKKLEEYFRHRGLSTELVFWESSRLHADKILRLLRKAVETYPDCVVDITGGTDAALFACGQLCAEADIPAFTFSRKKNMFYNIHNAEFAHRLECTVTHRVEDCFLMAGGALREGRVDNSLLDRYMKDFEPFFRLYLRHRNPWQSIVGYIQRASQTAKGESIPLHVSAPYTVKGERGTRISCPEPALRELEQLGFLKNVRLRPERVEFDFRDHTVRGWLRDIGSVLELYIYKLCRDSGLFQDVRTSAVVSWEGATDRDAVTNEIDVMAMQGVLPVFISCKTCEISTDALNELAILRDRFGGKGAKAAVVTARRCRSVTRTRAEELGIRVVDLDDLTAGRVGECLRAMMAVEE